MLVCSAVVQLFCSQCYCNAIRCANGRKAKLRVAFTQDIAEDYLACQTRGKIIDIINVVSFGLISVLCFFLRLCLTGD